MKIIITYTFKDIYAKYFWKEYKKCSIEKIITFIKKEKIKIYLRRPFQKIKINFCNKIIRLLVLNDEKNLIIIPIFITDKNDKKYWYNMIWDTLKEKIDKLMIKINLDLENDKFDEY